MPASPAPIRSISTASSASAAAWWTCSRPARRSRCASSSSATRSRRCAATTPQTQRSVEAIDQVLLAAAAGRAARGARRAAGRSDDAASRRRPCRHHPRLRRRRRRAACSWSSTPTSSRTARRWTRRWRAAMPTATRAGPARAAARRPIAVPWSRAGQRPGDARRVSICWRSTTRTAGARDRLPERQRGTTAASTSGSASCASAREARRDDAVRRRIGRPRRAHDRAAARIRRFGAAGRRRRGDARAPSCWSRPARSPPACGSPTPALTIVAEGDVFDDERVRRDRASRRRAIGRRPAHVLLRLPRPEGRRPRRPRRSRHRPVRRPEEARRRAPSAQEFMELRYAGDDKLFVPVERLDLVQKYSGGGDPPARSARRHHLGEGQDARQEGDARHGRRAAEALRRAQGRSPATPSAPTRTGRRSSSGAFEYDLTADQTVADRRHQARHGVADADGSAAVRRRRLRQDGSRDAGRVQGGDGWQAGRVPGADDRAGVPAPADAAVTLRGVPGAASTWSAASARKAEQKVDAGQPRAKASWTSSSARTACCRRTSSSTISDCSSSTRSSDSASPTRSASSRCASKVDVLTMSATPIPRTLNMSLVGIRDMSVIETPPRDRLAIQTNVVAVRPEGDRRRRSRNELERGGQVYFVHNRVESIYSMAGLLQRLVPEARDRRRPRPDGRGRAREGDGRLRRAAVRRAGGDDDHRERPRHPERQHDDHQPRRPLRPGAAVPAARPRRPIGSAGLRVPADAAGADRCRRSRASGWRRCASSATSAAASASPRSTSRSAAPATCSAASRAATSKPIGFEMYLKLLEETIRELKGEELEDDAPRDASTSGSSCASTRATSRT